MTVALIGVSGQLGSDLRAVLQRDVVALSHAEIEITNKESVEAALSKIEPQLVINTAAYNLVDKAEEEPETAYAVNALGPRNLANYCAVRDVTLVHIGSDYVFGLDAKRETPYTEMDSPGPLSVYGISKSAGEYFVQVMCRKYFIVRTCGLYGSHGGNGNFVETMLRLGAERDQLKVVDDQRCTPTSSSDLAGVISELVETTAYGLYHATNSGCTSWYQFACEIFRLAGMDTEVIPISTAEFAARARRPAYSVLDNENIIKTLGHPLRPWQQALEAYLKQREN